MKLLNLILTINKNYANPLSAIFFMLLFSCRPIAHNNSTSISETDSIQECFEIENITDSSIFTNIEIPQIIGNRSVQILKRTGYTCSYNQDTRNANWVAWHLTKEHTSGEWEKNGIPYLEDNDVIGVRQENSDWESLNLSKEGIDHGHICPAADNKWSKEAMVQSYLLTNMSPQNSELNRGIWETLESRCRGWAKHYGDLYIVAGPIFYTNNYKTFGTNKVGIPDAFYKVIYRNNRTHEGIGFIFPNIEPSKQRIEEYAYTIDEVENITGIDFFFNLHDTIESQIESDYELREWGLLQFERKQESRFYSVKTDFGTYNHEQYIDLNFPTNSTDSLKKCIIKNCFGEDTYNLNNAITNYLDYQPEYDEEATLLTSEPNICHGLISVLGDVKYYNSGFLSYELFNCYRPLGANQVQAYTKYINFSIPLQRELTIKDLIRSDNINDLHKLVYQKSNKEKLFPEYLTETIPFTENFYISNDSIYFVYAKYEITPGVEGCFKIGLKANTINEYLTELGRELIK